MHLATLFSFFLTAINLGNMYPILQMEKLSLGECNFLLWLELGFALRSGTPLLVLTADYHLYVLVMVICLLSAESSLRAGAQDWLLSFQHPVIGGHMNTNIHGTKWCSLWAWVSVTWDPSLSFPLLHLPQSERQARTCEALGNGPFSHDLWLSFEIGLRNG